ncbi:hypothetical protein NUACC26_062620 [Scytonema sp. NUACC26]
MVYRGYREMDDKPVVIKLLKNPYPSFSKLVQFRNQYTIAKNLNSPLIVQVYSLESYQNGYALVMEDFGGISLKDYFMLSSLYSGLSNSNTFLWVQIFSQSVIEVYHTNIYMPILFNFGKCCACLKRIELQDECS